jgi:excisionase family DNA binding protein
LEVTLRPGAALLLIRSIMHADHDGLMFAVPKQIIEEIATRAASIVLQQLPDHDRAHDASPFLSIPEAAEFLRAKRHRVDDLLSRGTLTRHKDGTRTLILRSELEAYIAGEPTGRAAR